MHVRTFRRAFTLIELLVVIAIIAILAVVVVLTLNPAQLLAQSRDASRVSDMATLNSAIGLYQTDTGGIGAMGTSSIAYVSLPDSSSTCGTWNLASGSVCVPVISTKNIDSTGWIPVNFKNISSGIPFGSLPIDPTNTSSSGLFYTYSTIGGQFELIAPMESNKYQQSVTGALGSGVATAGSGAGAPPIGYWPMDEGVGSTSSVSQTKDMSGSGNNGTWYGTAAGTSGYYSPGKVGSWAGAFNGTNNSIVPSSFPALSNTFSISTWEKTTSTSTMGIVGNSSSGNGYRFELIGGVIRFMIGISSGYSYGNCGTLTANDGNWHLVTGIFDVTNLKFTCYLDGSFDASNTLPVSYVGFSQVIPRIGSAIADPSWNGLLDDVRIYNRALSAAEIQALYNAGK